MEGVNKFYLKKLKLKFRGILNIPMHAGVIWVIHRVASPGWNHSLSCYSLLSLDIFFDIYSTSCPHSSSGSIGHRGLARLSTCIKPLIWYKPFEAGSTQGNTSGPLHYVVCILPLCLFIVWLLMSMCAGDNMHNSC